MENNLNNEAQSAADILSRAKANRKLIMGLSAFVAVVVVVILAWFFISSANARKADEAAGRADIAMATGNDSIALQLYKEAAAKGHKSGNRAKLEVAIALYEKADYKGALEYLNDASVDDAIIAAGALTLKGDCYVNLKQYPEAVKAFKAALKAADENPVVSPQILVKLANVYRAQKDFKAEYEAYQELADDYPTFSQTSAFDVEKYLSRAKTAAGVE